MQLKLCFKLVIFFCCILLLSIQPWQVFYETSQYEKNILKLLCWNPKYVDHNLICQFLNQIKITNLFLSNDLASKVLRKCSFILIVPFIRLFSAFIKCTAIICEKNPENQNFSKRFNSKLMWWKKTWQQLRGDYRLTGQLLFLMFVVIVRPGDREAGRQDTGLAGQDGNTVQSVRPVV